MDCFQWFEPIVESFRAEFRADAPNSCASLTSILIPDLHSDMNSNSIQTDFYRIEILMKWNKKSERFGNNSNPHRNKWSNSRNSLDTIVKIFVLFIRSIRRNIENTFIDRKSLSNKQSVFIISVEQWSQAKRSNGCLRRSVIALRGIVDHSGRWERRTAIHSRIGLPAVQGKPSD